MPRFLELGLVWRTRDTELFKSRQDPSQRPDMGVSSNQDVCVCVCACARETTRPERTTKRRETEGASVDNISIKGRESRSMLEGTEAQGEDF